VSTRVESQIRKPIVSSGAYLLWSLAGMVRIVCAGNDDRHWRIAFDIMRALLARLVMIGGRIAF